MKRQLSVSINLLPDKFRALREKLREPLREKRCYYGKEEHLEILRETIGTIDTACELLSDHDPLAQRSALMFLTEHLDDERVCKRLLDALSPELDYDTSENVAAAIRDAAEKGIDISFFVPKLAQIIVNPFHENRHKALRALSNAINKGTDLSPLFPALERITSIRTTREVHEICDLLKEAARRGYQPALFSLASNAVPLKIPGKEKLIKNQN